MYFLLTLMVYQHLSARAERVSIVLNCSEQAVECFQEQTQTEKKKTATSLFFHTMEGLWKHHSHISSV